MKNRGHLHSRGRRGSRGGDPGRGHLASSCSPVHTQEGREVALALKHSFQVAATKLAVPLGDQERRVGGLRV